MPRLSHLAIAPLAALALSACAGTYTGPVEVTRFISENPQGLGTGQVHVYFPEQMDNAEVKAAFTAAVENELRALGYTVVPQEGAGIQVASVRTTRGPIEGAGRGGRSPVSVGVGGGTGGIGIGGGIGISLGGGRTGPAVVTDLSVRITNDKVETLWEGRAELPTSVNSPYSDVDASAQALAAALFRDFPGGNGETVSIDVDDL